MNLYLDSSSLVKIYLPEEHSSLVRQWVDQAQSVATSKVAYPETLSAFRRSANRGSITENILKKMTLAFQSDWESYVRVNFDETLAGKLVIKHHLRGFDAVHLASALGLKHLGIDLHFSCFDDELTQAARREGLSILELS